MRGLTESFGALLEALPERAGGVLPPGDRSIGELFEASVAAFLGRSLEPERVQAILEGLRSAGLLEPTSLAEADVSEIDEALRPIRVILSAKLRRPLQRLARWFAGRESAGDASTDVLREE